MTASHSYYAQNLPASGGKDVALLDLCSSWVSHLPEGWTAGRVVGERSRLLSRQGPARGATDGS